MEHLMLIEGDELQALKLQLYIQKLKRDVKYFTSVKEIYVNKPLTKLSVESFSHLTTIVEILESALKGNRHYHMEVFPRGLTKTPDEIISLDLINDLNSLHRWFKFYQNGGWDYVLERKYNRYISNAIIGFLICLVLVGVGSQIDYLFNK